MSRFLPPHWFFVCLLCQAGLHLRAGGGDVSGSALRLAGISLLAGGLGLSVWGAGVFRRSGTSIRPGEVPSCLVSNGPYRFSRNPMYLGLTLALAGTAAFTGSVTPWVIVPVFPVLITRLFIMREEGVMREVFGAEFDGYCRQVRRWL